MNMHLGLNLYCQYLASDETGNPFPFPHSSGRFIDSALHSAPQNPVYISVCVKGYYNMNKFIWGTEFWPKSECFRHAKFVALQRTIALHTIVRPMESMALLLFQIPLITSLHTAFELSTVESVI